jgi:phosphoribosylaminoimidazole-succinocarboxamide synthase
MATQLLYEGKAKRVYESDQPGQVVMEFKDDATAFNGEKRGQIVDKGIINRALTVRLYRHLESAHVPTHLVGEIDERRLIVRKLDMIPLEVVVRNRVAGSLCKRIGLAEGTELTTPIVEFYFKNDSLGDPLLNEDHIRALGLCNEGTVAELRHLALRINGVLQAFLLERDLLLVDFKLEFGRAGDHLYLGDEISPDTCRLWDRTSLQKLDKDRFRQDLGDVEAAYQEVWKRVQA